jgi:hypothetical protein
VDAPWSSTARPPTTQRIAGSRLRIQCRGASAQT